MVNTNLLSFILLGLSYFLRTKTLFQDIPSSDSSHLSFLSGHIGYCILAFFVSLYFFKNWKSCNNILRVKNIREL